MIALIEQYIKELSILLYMFAFSDQSTKLQRMVYLYLAYTNYFCIMECGNTFNTPVSHSI